MGYRWLSIIYFYVNFQLLTVRYEVQSFACSVEGGVVTLIKMGCVIYTFKGVLTATNPKLPSGCNQTPIHV